MKIIKHFIIYDTENGEILHIHGGFDASTESTISLTKNEAIETLSDFLPEPEKVGLLVIDSRGPVELARMRVNLKDKCLEPIPPEKEEKK